MSSNAYEEGLKIRKAVLGEEYVNRALENVNSFNAPLQQLVTEYCWGKIWGARDRIANEVFAESGVTLGAQRAE